MEEKERYEFGQRTLFNNREELTTFDGFNLDDFMQIICKLLNQQDKRIKELEQENLSLQEQSIRDNQNWIEETTQLKQQLALTEKALDYAIFELDFARNHSQSTNSETLERIDKLRNKILNKAKEMLANE